MDYDWLWIEMCVAASTTHDWGVTPDYKGLVSPGGTGMKLALTARNWKEYCWIAKRYKVIPNAVQQTGLC